jgi:hypothetical protein
MIERMNMPGTDESRKDWSEVASDSRDAVQKENGRTVLRAKLHPDAKLARIEKPFAKHRGCIVPAAHGSQQVSDWVQPNSLGGKVYSLGVCGSGFQPVQSLHRLEAGATNQKYTNRMWLHPSVAFVSTAVDSATCTRYIRRRKTEELQWRMTAVN